MNECATISDSNHKPRKPHGNKTIFSKKSKNKVWHNNNLSNNQNCKSHYKPYHEGFQNFNGRNRNGNGHNERSNHYSAHFASCPIYRHGCNPSICQAHKAIKKVPFIFPLKPMFLHTQWSF